MSQQTSQDQNAWQVLDETVVFSHQPWVHVVRQHVRLPNGVEIPDFYWVDMPIYSMIFPVTTDGQVVMVEQYRHGAGKTLLELPAGNIDTDDINVQTALEAAQRELQEETGYTADEWLPLGYFHMDANRKAGAFYAFLAKSARQTHPPDLHETELIQTKLIDLADLRQLWMAHHFENVSTAAVVGLALATLDAMNTKDTP